MERARPDRKRLLSSGGLTRPVFGLCVLLLAAVAVGVGAAGAAHKTPAASPAAKDAKAPIVIGIADGQTGFLAAFETEAINSFKLRVDQINKKGGVLGRKIVVEVADTKSTKAGSATAGLALLNKGAQVLIVTCDLDFGGPAASEANAKGVVAISFCAGDPHFADKKTLGPLAFTMGTGSDIQGVTAAEWAFKTKHWHSAYVILDKSQQFLTSLQRYFDARWKTLGGTEVGRDVFVGAGTTINTGPMITRLQGAASKADVIVLNSILPSGGVVLRAIRAAGINNPVLGPGYAFYGPTLTKITGPVHNFYTDAIACLIDCKGDPQAASSKDFLNAFVPKYGQPNATTQAIFGWDLAQVVATGIKRAGTTQGKALMRALETMPPLQLTSGKLKFTSRCHAPALRPLVYMAYNGKTAKFVGRFAPSTIPDLKDGNPCLTH
jgi:branched-chain amino acid transport system substrate-binding protein